MNKYLYCLIILLILSPFLSKSQCTDPSDPTAPDQQNCGKPASVTLNASGSTGNYLWYDTTSNGTIIGDSSSYITPVLSKDTSYYYVAAYDTAITNALSFDASNNEYLSIKNIKYDKNKKYYQVTVEAWIKTNDNADQIIGSFDRSEYWRLEIGGSADPGKVAFDVQTDAGITDYGGNTRVDDGKWHHVAAVYDSGAVRIFIDGKLDASTTMGDYFGDVGENRYGFVGVGSEASGEDGSTGPADYFNGDIDEFKVWDTARTHEEIRNTYQRCIPGSEKKLQIHYAMDDGSGSSTVTDSSGNGNDADLKNMDINTAWINSGPEIMGCCESNLVEAKVILDTIPDVSLRNDTCVKDSITLDPGAGYASYLWNDGSSNQTLTAKETNYNYWVEVSDGTCTNRDSVRVNVSDKPEANDSSRCGPGVVSLKATGSSKGYAWFDSPQGGNMLDSGQVFQTPSLTSTTDYYVSSFDSLKGNALNFDGVDDYVAIQDFKYESSSLKEVTVEAWIKTNSKDDQIIATFDRSEYWRLEINGEGGSDGELAFDINTDNDQLDFTSNKRVDDGNWHHVAAVFDNGNVKLYVDGNLENSTSTGNKFGSGTKRYGFLGVGSEADDPPSSQTSSDLGPDYYFDGSITDARVWKRALSGSEISNNYNQCVIGDNGNLKLHYLMTDNSGDTLTDNSGNSNTGVLTNMNASTDWVAGPSHIDKCLSLGCTSEFRDTATATIYTIPDPAVAADTCNDTSIVLDAGSGFVSYLWNDGSTADTLVADTSGLYWVEVDNGNCDHRDTSKVLVVPEPSANDTSRCGPGKLTLKADGSSGIYYWYDSSAGGTPLDTTDSFTTPSLNNTKDYYVSAFDSTGTEVNNNALNFDGDDDYVALDMAYNNSGALPEMAAEAWVKTSAGSGGSFDNWAIVDFDRSEYYNFYIRPDNGKVGFSTKDNDNSSKIHDMEGNTVVNDGKWHHIAVVYDGTDKIIYVDGAEDARASNPHGGNPLGTGDTRYGIIGDGSESNSLSSSLNGGNNLNEFYYDGQIDEVRIWNTMRTQSQIKKNINEDVSKNKSGLQAYYKMNSGSGNTLKDKTGNHDGTLANMESGDWISNSVNIREIDCESPRKKVTAIIDTIPESSIPSDTCSPEDSVQLDAGAGFVGYKWNDGSTNQKLWASKNDQYWVEVDDGKCKGKDTVQVSLISKPNSNDTSRCGNGAVKLVANGSTKNYIWYDKSSGGTILSQSDTFNATSLNKDTSFYVAACDTTGINRQALTFDGSDDYIALHNFNYNGSNYKELTVEAWIKTTDGGDQFIASYDRNEYWRLEINGVEAGTGKIGFDILTDAGQEDFGGDVRIDDGNWHHVAGVFDNGKVSIYIDGSLDKTTNKGSKFGSGNEKRFGFIGMGSEASVADGNINGGNHFNGEIDELKIWHEAKDSAYFADKTKVIPEGNEANLVSYYNMSFTNDTLIDNSTSNHFGTLQNMNKSSAIINNIPFTTCGDCESYRQKVSVKVHDTINSVSITQSCPGKNKTSVKTSSSGGSGKFDYRELGGAFNYSGSFSSSPQFYNLTNNGSYTIEVKDENDCKDTSATFSTPADPSNIVGTATSSSCMSQGQNNWIYITNGSGDALAAVKDKGTALGNITVETFLESNPQTYNDKAYMERHFTINTANAPGGSGVDVRLLFKETELNEYKDTTQNNSLPEDDFSDFSELGVTKYSGSSEDGTYDPSGGTTKFITQDDSGSAFGGKYIQFNVSGFSEFWIHASTQFQPLPVNFTSFNVEKKSNKNVLKWSTNNEINNDYFIVQRSVNGYSYENLGRVDGEGNSSGINTYSFVDNNTTNSLVYYRIKQVDYNDDYIYSDIKKLRRANKKLQFNIYPNPARNIAHLDFNRPINKGTLKIVNTLGKTIKKRGSIPSSGKLDLSELKSGVYFIIINAHGDRYSEKIILH